MLDFNAAIERIRSRYEKRRRESFINLKRTTMKKIIEDYQNENFDGFQWVMMGVVVPIVGLLVCGFIGYIFR